MSIPKFVSDKSLTLHGVFEAQVEKTPEAIALVFEQEQLTYRELNERANQLAHYLRSLNAAPEMLVGICLERSIEMIVGMLGILKAGAAFAPLAPSQPQERLAFILADTKVEILLTLKKLVAGIPVPPSHLICLDAQEENIAAKSKSNPVSGVQSDNLAYTIYTSGSTGQPKGVMVSHQAVCQGFLWMQEIFPITQQDRILQKLPLTFDFSFWELFWPLMTGACVVLAQPGGEKDSAYLVKLIARQKISILIFVPSVLQVFLSEEGLKTCKNIRMVFTGGEPLTSTLKARFFNQLPNCRLYDLFGATENIIVTYWPCQSEEKLSSFPQGRPFPNLSIYVVDEQLQLVPVGETGELLVGGWGLARGYLNRPELTAQKFIFNPFKENSQERLYRTGDRVRYLSDGTIEILGRIDNQVKVRGFRIELGEIEEKLSQHPAVKQVVVIAREEVAGDKRLVAYVVLHSFQDSQPSISLLRHFLQQQLPDYMIPSGFVVLEALPLSPNGKVDRRALPVPEIRPADLPTFVAPRTPIEEMLAGIWANILRVELVGIHDNFFNLGGHSLLAAQIIARMRVSLGVELPFSRLLEFPTVAGLAQIVEEARQQKGRSIALPLKPISRNQTIPLSFSQEQLWFLHQLAPEEPVYNEPCTVSLKGAINVDALEKALNEIIKRHESLRTRFLTVDGQPVQVIDPPHTFNLAVVDLRQFPQEQREAEALRLATKQAKHSFDLTSDLLLRATLMQLADVDYKLFLTFHHIVIDDVSIQSVFLKELAALYEAYSKGKPSPLAPLPVQYADFAVWQRQWLTQEILSSQLDYWKQQLADLPVVQLPYDRPRPAVGTFRGAWQCLVLSKNLTESLKALSQQSGVTLYMTLLAAFKTLLYRYSGSDDIVVGTVSARRNRPEIEGLIGYFLNTLVLRTNLSGNPSFREVLKRVREVTLGAYAHEDLPYQKLVQTLQPERNFSQNPLFQVALVQEAPMPSLNLDWTRSYLDIQTDTAKFDLTLELDSRPEGIVGRFVYNTDLFEAATISRMIEHFQTMLAGIVANPIARISELPLLTEPERYQLLVEWNNTTKEYPQDKCIHHLFEEQVERSPDAIAVVFEDKQLTYRELNQQANQLAHYLQSLGVGPEVLVGICVERSLLMMVGLLGILKAGGAYVPLDPAYPSERLAFMLKDSSVPVLLTQAQQMEKLPPHSAHVVCLDSDWGKIAQESLENTTSMVTPDKEAYVIYTSGSTGKPKGVTVPHRAVNRLVLNTNYVNLQSTDVVAFASNFSFDAATFEIWGALLHGARLVGVSKDVVLSPNDFAQLIQKQEISVLFLTTALFNQIASVVPSAFRSVQHLLFGGEAVEPRWVKQVLKNRPPSRLLHVYGPTECTTFTTWYLVQDVPEEVKTIPIGCPISNTRCFLLDAHKQPVPVGVPGELYIGGDGLAQGYLNRLDLTDEKFIPNPFSNELGERLYKTGDKARYLPDGNIEFLGRIDNQVKIRGFRIELGEIEAAIAQYPGVRETVVIAREDIPDRKYLAAYIVSNQSNAPTIRELRGFLKQILPDYMMPGAFVILDVLPLTLNGKVDRLALPIPPASNDSDSLVLPRTLNEEILAGIWKDVLGLELVGVHDNFFELGGDSIISLQIIARANQAGIQITTKQLFQYQTIAELAIVANTTSFIKADQGLVTGVVPLTPIQYWFFDQNWSEPDHFNQSMMLVVPPDLKPALLEQVVKELMVHHDTLRMRFVRDESGWQQLISSNCKEVPFQVMDLSALGVEEHKAAIERIAAKLQTTLNLEEGLLLRVVLFNLGSDLPGRLLLIIHHLVVDGVSWRILLEDITTVYKQLEQGSRIQLPPKSTSFKDWAIRQRDYGRSSTQELELDYWLTDSYGDITPIPVDYPAGREANTEGSTAEISVFLNEEETRTLLQEVPSVYNTQINDVLLTALVQTFARWKGDRSVLIELEGHGREELFKDVNLSRTVGWFTTIFPVLLQLGEADEPGVALKSIKEQLRRIPNRGIGYGILRYLSQNADIGKQLQARSIAEVCFNYLGQFDQVIAEPISLEFAPENPGRDFSPKALRCHLLNVIGQVVEGKLQMIWIYSQNIHRRSTIERLTTEYDSALKALIAHCQSPDAGGYTPTDFPLADLSQQELDELLCEID